MGIKNMASTASNPLQKHFRQPALYLKLPSDGKFWPEGSIELSMAGDIPVYPMTVKDEITIKTPDALMNGSGVADVIKSCCPNIVDPWAIPVIDIDAILLSIRSASYGAEMDIDTKCPHCSGENTHALDLRVLLDNINPPSYAPVTINDLEFHFKPQTFKNLNQNNLINYEQQKLISTINNSELTEEQKLAEFQRMFPKLTDLNIDTLANSIDSVVVDGNLVVERGYIKEFLNNCDRQLYSEIKSQIEQLNEQTKLKPIEIACVECTKPYTTEVTFDQSNFFE
jgi:hypothetical protein